MIGKRPVIVVCIFVFVIGTIIAKETVLHDSIEDFLVSVVKDTQERVEFRGYYSRFLEKQSRKRRSSKRGYLRRLRSATLQTLKKEHSAWYKEVEPYLFDLDESTPEARKVRLFLIRFSLLKKYRQSKLPQEETWWKSFKTSVKDFGRSIAQAKDKVFHKKIKA